MSALSRGTLLLGLVALVALHSFHGTLHVVPSRRAEAFDAGRLLARRQRRSSLLSRDDVLRRVPVGGLAFATLANTAYAELAINWALLLQPMLAARGEADHMFVGALDESVTAQLVARSLPTLRCGLGGINASAPGVNASAPDHNFRLQFGMFRAYGVTKAEILIWLLGAGRHVVMSDVDSAWLAPPHALLDELREADVMTGTDCLDVPEDDDRSERSRVVVRCGHHPGSSWSAWFNTGVMIWRATAGARELAAEWRARMAAVHGDGSFAAGSQVDDQLTFNQLLWGEKQAGGKEPIYPVRAARPDGRVILDGSGRRRVVALPARQVCSGHVYGVQQSQRRRGCLVLHLTFVEAGVAAKHWRLREAGLLEVDPEPLDGKYLTFAAPLPGPTPPERAEGLAPGREMPGKTKDGRGWPVATAIKWSPRLVAHLELVDRHIAALRNAIGMAKALGRQLVMPRMLCLCERSEGPAALLPSCVLDGSSTPIPHVCPLESILDVARLDRLWPYVRLRPWNFLNASIHRPRGGAKPIDATNANDLVTVRWSDSGATPAAAPALPPIAGLSTAATNEVWLPRGLSDRQLIDGLQASKDARVIHLEAAEGAFGGFEDQGEGDRFHTQIMTHMLGGFSATWCCTSWDKPRGTITFKRPVKLPSGDQARAGATRPPEIPEKRACYWSDCDAQGHQK